MSMFCFLNDVIDEVVAKCGKGRMSLEGHTEVETGTPVVMPFGDCNGKTDEQEVQVQLLLTNYEELQNEQQLDIHTNRLYANEL